MRRITLAGFELFSQLSLWTQPDVTLLKWIFMRYSEICLPFRQCHEGQVASYHFDTEKECRLSADPNHKLQSAEIPYPSQ